MLLRTDRYVVFEPIAAGGMASVHIGRMRGPLGFSRTVAVKRLHPHLLEDGTFVTMLVEEARVASRIQHPAVVQTIDIVSERGEVLLIMEYVHGESLAKLLRTAVARAEAVPPPIAASIAAQMLRGLHAAHEVTDESGRRLDLVHRDVSPQNVLVGAEGEVKVLDFGVAKVLGRAPTTRAGQVKGKLSYMAPEQFLGEALDRRTDVFAAGIVLWEMLVGGRLFDGDQGAVIARVVACDVAPPSQRARPGSVDAELDAVVMKALARRPEDRYPTAAAMVAALEERGGCASTSQVGAWVRDLCHESLDSRRARVAEIEREGLEREPDDVEASGPPIVDATQSQAASAIALPASLPAPRKSLVATALVTLLVVASLAGVGVFALRARAELGDRPSIGGEAPVELATSPTPRALPPGDPEGAPSQVSMLAPSGASPATSSSAPAVAPRGTARPVRSIHPRAPAADCTNPYVLDEGGHRRYRRECLRN